MFEGRYLVGGQVASMQRSEIDEPNATISQLHFIASRLRRDDHHVDERNAANASSSVITRISPDAIPSTRHGPIATRINRSVGKPTCAVIRRT